MIRNLLFDLYPILAEIILVLSSIILLLIGVIGWNKSVQLTSWLAVISLIIAMIFLPNVTHDPIIRFNGLFVIDAFGVFFKKLLLLSTSIAIIMSIKFNIDLKIDKIEYPVLLLLSAFGMMIMLSANDLMSFYLGMEIMSLILYVLAAFNRNSITSIEAGLKYFILGSISSVLFLYGSSIIYGYTGTTSFNGIAQFLLINNNLHFLWLCIGLIFIIVSIAFKIAAVPFHMWIPDVYEGAPTSVVAFFITAPKITAIAVLIKVTMIPFIDLYIQWHYIIIILSICSMILGALAGIQQTNIKRLMAYSSIGHVGYILIGLATGSSEGIQAILVYIIIYLVMNIAVFAIIISIHYKDKPLENIHDLTGLSKNNPLIALSFLLLMFSMVGIPPMAGFFGKVYILYAAIHHQMYILAIIGVLTSAISAYYYLRIIKIIYFDQAIENYIKMIIHPEIGSILVISIVFISLFVFFPQQCLDVVSSAITVLLIK